MSDGRGDRGADLAETGFELGDWSVRPALNRLSRGEVVVHLRPRVMDVLVLLARRPGEVVSKAEILDALWGKRFLADTALTRAVFELREALGDDPRDPRYVATVPKRGYGLVAPVTVSGRPTGAEPTPPPRVGRLLRGPRALGGPTLAALALSFVGAVGTQGHQPASAAPSPVRRIVVLPFENLGSAEDSFLTAGLADEITSRLASVRGLAVISRSSAERLVASGRSETAIGAELTADFVLAGTVRWDRGGARRDRVRITPKLVRVSDGTQMWAAVYDETIQDVLRVQADVAASVITEIGVRLTGAAREAIKKPPTNNPEAYQAFLRAVYHSDTMYNSDENLRLAIQLFGRAVELDPDFASAWAALAVTRSGMFHMGYDRSAATCAEARRAAERAVALAAGTPDAHNGMGYYLYWCQRDYRGALDQFALARRSHGESARAWAAEGYVLRRLGRWDEALAVFRRAATLDPMDANADRELGLTSLSTRRYAQAEQHFRHAIGLLPDQAALYGFLAQTYWHWRGDTEQARAALQAIPRASDPWLNYWWYWQELYEGKYQAALERAERSTPGVITNDAVTNGRTWDSRDLMLGRAYALLGRTDEARRSYEAGRLEIEGLLRERPDDFALHSALGIALAGLGRGAEAVSAARRGVALMPPAKDALDSTLPLHALAEIKTVVGDHEGACRDLAALLTAAGGPSVALLELDPRWAPLRSRPCYAAVVRSGGVS